MRTALFLVPMLVSCALSHQVPGQSDGGVFDGNAPDGSRADANTADGNVDVCEPPPAERTPVLLGEVFSATFVGAHFHLEAEFDGVRRYAIAEVVGQDLRVVNYAELEGPANWVPARSAGPEHYARARVEGEGLVIETLDARSPLAPSVASALAITTPRAPRYTQFFSVHEDRLYFCLPGAGTRATAAGEQGVVSLSALEYEGLRESRACANRSGFLSDEVSVSWRPEGHTQAFSLSDPTLIAEYNYSPDGIHAYGAVIDAATDGVTVVLDTENAREFFLFRLDSPGRAETNFAHAYFPAANGGRLVDVVDSSVYFATSSGLIAYATLPDVWQEFEWARPAQEEWSMSGELELDSLTSLASSTRELVILEDAELMIAPLDGSAAALRPASVFVEVLPPNPCR